MSCINSTYRSRNMNKKITLVNLDDWEAIYIDGKKALDGHSIRITELLDLLGIDYKELEITDEFMKKTEETGYVPDNESDLNNMECFK